MLNLVLSVGDRAYRMLNLVLLIGDRVHRYKECSI